MHPGTRRGTGRKSGISPVGVLLFLVCAPLFVPLAHPLGAQVGQPEVASIRFEGNENVSDRSLANAILTRPTECRVLVLRPFCWLGADFAIAPAFLSPRDLRDDVNRLRVLYYQRGFREAQVDTLLVRPEPDIVEITFRIDEGRPILTESLEVVGLEDLEGVSVPQRLPVLAGEPMDLLGLNAARDTLLTRLRNQGFPHVDVFRNIFIPAETPYEAQVIFEVVPGARARFGEIEIVGNEQVSERVIRRMLPFTEGDDYDRSLLAEGQRNLFNLEIFRHADIIQDLEAGPDSVIPLRVQVNEGNVNRMQTGGGWSTAECFNLESIWSSRNFTGGARRLRVRGRLSNIAARSLENSICQQAGGGVYGRLNWLTSVDFSQPWVFSPRNSLAASLFAERQSLPDVFVRQGYGVNLALTRSLGRTTPLTFAYRPQIAQLDAAEIFFCTSFLICDPTDIDVLQRRNWLAPVSLTFSTDQSNRLLDPSAGFSVFLDLEHASRFTGSDFNYERIIAEYVQYWEPLSGILPDVITAYRLRAGWLSSGSFGGLSAASGTAGIDHPQKRFFSGGANSVRGFAQNQLGPRVLTVPVENLILPSGGAGAPCTPQEVIQLSCDADPLPDGSFFSRPTGGSNLVEGSVELRFPIVGNFQGATFVDFGQVSDQRLVDFDQIDFTPGLGVRYMTALGPVRFDVGYRLATGDRLRVVTSQIRPFDSTRDDPAARIGGLDYVPSTELALLEPRVLFDDSEPFSFRRFQLHFSIGQAF